ncbi:pol [Symbiodinium sp. KB8]|nr:pol [Symbiodinium sp. KB8]
MARANAPPVAASADANAPPEDPDRWTSFDLGRALQDLRSIREGVVRRALRKLHIRWFHASAQRMKTLLTAAGVSPEIMVLVQQIVDTCDICRNWTRPGPRTVTSATVTTRFNEEIQVDLLFYRDKIILHMIDRTTRFTVARRIASKHLDNVVEGVMSHWVGMFGPPNRITSDQEGAFQSPEAAALLESRGIKLHLLAKEQHASIVERHHAILRRQLHVLEEQSTAEGLRISFDAILGEAVYAKNALFAVGGASPFEAVFGRTPPLLGVVDAEIGDSPDDRDSDRVRQIAIQSMIQATAESKMKRADRGKSRMPGELLDLQVGDAVEFYRRATTKDAHSWFGPATVTDLTSVRDGQIGVKWQGPYEPSLPQLRDVTAQVERFDIFTPSEATCVEGDEESADVMPEAAEQLFSRYASRAPQVVSDEAPESAFVFDVIELEAEDPSIAFNACSARYLSANPANVEPDELLVFEYGTDEAVIERTHNILSRQEALANAELLWGKALRRVLGEIGIAWVVQTRPDIAVFVAALQRKMQAPTILDVCNLNRLLKYVKVKPLDMVYHKVDGPWSLVAISDSSFKGEGQEHTAIRSGIVALTSRDGVQRGLNKLQVLEVVSKKQSRICRSTYAAELFSALDLTGLAMTINAALTEVLMGNMSPTQLVELQDRGEHALKLWLILDAKSVVSGAVSDEVKCTDQACLLHLLKLREFLNTSLSAIVWTDTRDMLADGLTKGVICRDALRSLAETGRWDIAHEIEVHMSKRKIS